MMRVNRKVAFLVVAWSWVIGVFCGIATARADEGTGPPAPQPAPTFTPGPVLSTGGNTTGTSPGSGCLPRTLLRNNPPPQSNIFAWYNNGDVGWPFGWPGMVPPNVFPTTAPTVGCSR